MADEPMGRGLWPAKDSKKKPGKYKCERARAQWLQPSIFSPCVVLVPSMVDLQTALAMHACTHMAKLVLAHLRCRRWPGGHSDCTLVSVQEPECGCWDSCSLCLCLCARWCWVCSAVASWSYSYSLGWFFGSVAPSFAGLRRFCSRRSIEKRKWDFPHVSYIALASQNICSGDG